MKPLAVVAFGAAAVVSALALDTIGTDNPPPDSVPYVIALLICLGGFLTALA